MGYGVVAEAGRGVMILAGSSLKLLRFFLVSEDIEHRIMPSNIEERRGFESIKDRIYKFSSGSRILLHYSNHRATCSLSMA